MKVLIIPEDQHLDRYIAKPVIEALFADLGRPARIDVLPEPRLRGASEALDKGVVDAIVAENPMVDLFLLVVDLDCDREGHAARAAERQREHSKKLLACLAQHELEVWMLALYKEQLRTEFDGSFSQIREECDPKERWAEQLLEDLGTGSPGGGRKSAMKKLAGNYRSLRDTCVEIRDLEGKIRAWLAARAT